MTAPAARYLSLGAGIQSSTCLLLAIQGKIPPFDAAVFADTGWEPTAVYTHLDRLERLAATAGIPLVRVRTGERHGLAGTPKSSCLGCPFHDDGFWAALKANSPAEWADAVAFDAAIRNGSARANADGHPLRGQFFLHRQRVPLDQVVFRPHPVPADEQLGCGPWTCPHPAERGPADSPGAVPVREVA